MSMNWQVTGVVHLTPRGMDIIQLFYALTNSPEWNSRFGVWSEVAKKFPETLAYVESVLEENATQIPQRGYARSSDHSLKENLWTFDCDVNSGNWEVLREAFCTKLIPVIAEKASLWCQYEEFTYEGIYHTLDYTRNATTSDWIRHTCD